MHKHIYKTYIKRNIFHRLYTLPFYFLPILIGITKEYLVTSLFTTLLAVLLLFLTLWVPRLNILFTLKEVGSLFEECTKTNCINQVKNFNLQKNSNKILFVFYKQTLCKIENDIFIYKFNSFYVKNNQIYFLSLNTKHEFGDYLTGKVQPKFLEYFPKNEFNVRPPLFMDLFFEHATAPFFVFQIFCGVLWCLDEYVYHALFTIVMLILFEMGVVLQRIKTMEEFKRMNLTPIKICKIFKKTVIKMSSEELKPGDLVEITEPIKIPCDLLILEGNCAVNEAMLSGESTPFSKESIFSRNKEEIFDYKRDKLHILYAGTEILKTTKLKCYVLKTGFTTLQGSLISKMISNENTVSANNKESFLFILFLLFFAVISSVYSFIQSKKLNKSNYKILLEIIIILTNVVPPELPMELTIAVNNAVQSLIRKGVFCIEPFRIPLAGKVDVCCFDKTGTLTESKLTVHKIQLNKNDESMIYACKLVISSCHSLILLNDKVEGDPMEFSSFNFLGIKLEEDDKSIFDNKTVLTVKKYPFTSLLRRMTVIAKENDKYYTCVKGAPEVIKNLLKEVPVNYNQYEEYAKEGYRVLALAFKEIKEKELTVKREILESKLTFIGFILYECKIKEDAFFTVQQLLSSNHQVIMITGDNLLTAENVSKKLKIITPQEKGVEGEEIDSILEKEDFYKVKVFARANPEQKERIIERYKKSDKITLMCGDGTNDVGALKTAHVGVAVLDKSSNSKSKSKTNTKTKTKIDFNKLTNTGKITDNKNSNTDSNTTNTTDNSNTTNTTDNTDDKKSDNKKSDFSNDGNIISNFINNAINESNDEVIVKPGDASVAAPFTAKNGKLESVLEVIRHGRSALVTTIQMHKILALNSLISAFSLSVLDSKGIRFSDFQMTLSGILLAFSFMFLTTSKPLREIHEKKPLTKIFNKYIILSIIGQTLFHIITYLFILNYFPYEPNLSEKFSVNLLNSVIFIINLAQQLSTFIINYIGRPYRESITENKPLFISLLSLSFFLLMLITQFSKEILDQVEIIDLSGNRILIGSLVCFNFIGCYLVERVCLKYFMN